MQQDRVTAGRSLKLMFTSQIVAISGLVLALIGLWAALSPDNYKPYPTNGGIALTLAMLAGLAIIVSGVMNIVAVVKCRKAHTYFQYVLYVLLASFVANLLLGGVSDVLKSIVTNICSMAVCYLICTATDELAALSGEVTYRPTGALVWKIQAVGTVLSLISGLGFGAIVVTVAGVVAIACSVVYLLFLYRAGNFLQTTAIPAPQDDPLN